MAAANYKIRFTTGGRLSRIETWLRQNAKSEWSFKLEDVSDDMSKKTYVVMFSDKADYDLFRMRFPPTLVKPANRNPEPGGKTDQAENQTATQETANSVPAAVVAEPAGDTPPEVKPDAFRHLKYTAGNFVSALAKAFANTPVEEQEERPSSLPASFRSGAKSTSGSGARSSSATGAKSSSGTGAKSSPGTGAKSTSTRSTTPPPKLEATAETGTNIVID